ncbi:hypothetical protein tloyanaT_02000 [Thalassotalea loyana]|uniref:Uncharacterized protein n=1 Tax=Thalassotalea loyana TaxID=280483 RepID=A0ABQ6H744_9GAMM|nr:hypothetical protein [Thalassotalea loyana]GLX83948.1 hypothetical protein tloyanaT_02000 [Thalassotalea loyana]
MKSYAIKYLLLSFGISLTVNASIAQENLSEQEYHQWLKDKFSDQHERLIPVVAVADMYFACNKVKKIDPVPYRVPDLLKRMDREQLAEKLIECLGTNDIQSDIAINYGLEGCFYEQLADKPKQERDEKMKLVRKAIASLSREERQKSLTQCVTSQAIAYLK